jgi:signal transduction histidine kinase
MRRDDGPRAPAGAIPGDLAQTTQAVAVARARDAVMVEVNDAFCALVGRPREEIVGRTADVLGISDRDRLDWLIERFPAPGQSHHQRRVFETPAGRRLADLDIHGLDVGGERMIVSVINPVEAAAEAPDLLTALLDAAPQGLVIYDRDLRIVRLNRASERIGTVGAKDVGRLLRDAVPDAPAANVAAIESVFATGEPVVGMPTTGVDGRSYLLTVFPIMGATDRVEQVATMILDVTDRVATERALAESEAHRREILARMLQAEEVQRSQIATELHDDTVQVMAAALIQLDRAALVAVRTGNERLSSALGLTRATLEEATERTRRLMFELRPAVLHDHGLLEAMRVLAGQVAREVGARADVVGTGARYDLAVEELVYRTAQEALANVRKHARPSAITVTLSERSGQIVGEVEDDGSGFDVVDVRTRASAPLHLGLDSMVERVRAVGGEVTVESAPGAGTRVRFAVPTAFESPVSAPG